MAYDGLLVIGGTEIVNHLRTTTYIRSLGCRVNALGDICGTLSDYLDDPTYSTPSADDAPWYDPDGEPESANFAGLLVTKIVGLDTSGIARPIVDNAGDGASVGRLRRKPRTILVTGWLYGRTCCATAAGLRWLSRALAEPDCPGEPGDCGGSDLRFLDACPTSENAHAVGRTLHQVSAVDGPNVLDRFGTHCGICNGADRIQVEFTLLAADPYAYRDATNILSDDTFGGTGGTCVEWSVDPGDCPDCDPSSDPFIDPAAHVKTPPPAPRIIPVLGGCAPLSSARQCYEVAAELVPQWAQGVPLITITAGDTRLRNLVISFGSKPGGGCDELAACDSDERFALQYLPANATLVIDGSRQSATITVDGVTRDATGMLAGIDGSAFTWPLIDCGASCICLDYSSDETAGPDGEITIDLDIAEA